MNEFYNENGFVLCQICGKPYNFITGRHLSTHQTTLKAYKETHPGAPLSKKDTCEKTISFKRTKQTNKENFIEPEIEELDLSETFSDSKPFKENKSIIDMANKKVSVPSKNKDPLDDKIEIISYLKLSYPNIKNNYMFKKKTPTGMIECQLVTDMADPSSKTVFDFPKSFWHNEQVGVSSNTRNRILISYGWKIVTINDSMPRVFHVEKVVNGIKNKK